MPMGGPGGWAGRGGPGMGRGGPGMGRGAPGFMHQQGGGRGMRDQPVRYPDLYSIFHGIVATVKDFGAFIELPGYRKNGLVHKSHMSQHPVEDASQVVAKGEKVWVKVIKVDEAEERIGLSMKYVSQGDGRDLDANNVQLSMEGDRSHGGPRRGRGKVVLEAVYETKCTKCGGGGHMAFECFASGKPDGRSSAADTYQLLEAGSDEDVPLRKIKPSKRGSADTQNLLKAMAFGGEAPLQADDVPDKKRSKKSKSTGLSGITSLEEAERVLSMLEKKSKKKSHKRKRTSRSGEGRERKRSRRD